MFKILWLLPVLMGWATVPWACAHHSVRPVPLLARPDLPHGLDSISPDSPLAPILAATARSDCSRVVTLSAALMEDLTSEVRQVFPGDEAERPPAPMVREFLDRTVHANPPLLEVGRHRFEFPRWWMVELAYCLVEEDRIDEARAVYLRLLQDRPEVGLLWCLALVYAWDGQPDLALELLRRWPEDRPQPAGFTEVVRRLQAGGTLPRSVSSGGPRGD